MLDCFDGLVSLDATCEGGTAGVVTLQSIGIDQTLLGKFTGAEDTVSGMLSDVETWARMTVYNDAVNARMADIKGHTFVDRQRIGDADDSQTLMAGTAGTIGGIVVETSHPGSNIVIRIGMGYYYGNTPGTTTFTVYDLEDGSTVTTYTLTAVAGKNVSSNIQIALPAYRQSKRYLIAHTALDYYQVNVASGSCSACGEKGYRHGGVNMYGARISNAVSKKYSNLQRVSHTSGMGITVTVECDHGQWLCEVKNSLALPYLYKVGQGLITRGIDNLDRFNSYAGLNRDILVERAARYSAEYARAMDNTVGKMAVPDDPMCFSCKVRTMSISALP